MTAEPGAEISGFILPSSVGPTEEKLEMASVFMVEPTPMTFWSPGELAVLQAGPEFPMENRGMILAACHASITALYQGFPRPPPQELETRWGAFVQSFPVPSASVGQAKNWPQARRSAWKQELEEQPRHAAHFAPGATPIPRAPAMVPVVCVPCPFLSEGTGSLVLGSNHP